MNIFEFKNRMNELCPLELQEEWDNSGLQINASQSESGISRVLVTLEINQAVVDEAKNSNVDMIVTHHPLFFGGFKQIIPEMLPTRYAMELIRSGISVYSAHTNFDSMEGGNNDCFAKLLELEKVESFGMLRSAIIDNTDLSKDGVVSVKDFALLVAKCLELDNRSIRIIGNPAALVKKVAWCTGAGADFYLDAKDIEADLFITGDVKYHEAATMAELGLNCLDIGHFGSEKIFTPNMTSKMKEMFPELDIISSNCDKDPFHFLNE